MDTSELAEGDSCHKLGSAVKQVDEKHAFSEMKEMIWSPKMDLVAAVTAAEPNEIILYRLHGLKKMWTHSSSSEGANVMSVAWDPMGKCIAVAYSSQQIVILAVEKAGVLYTHDTRSVPTKLHWLTIEKKGSDEGTRLYKDISNDMLPKLPSVNREDESHPSIKQINQDQLNYLVVSGEDGLINIYVYGLLSISCINLHNYSSQECNVRASCLSTSGSHLISVSENPEGNLHITSLKTEVLSTRREEIQTIADKFVQLVSLLESCDFSINKMIEAWEDGLLELDSKLNNFSTEKQRIGEGTVLNDFLELLLFGTPSDELKIFLLKDMTERGMKKLGTSLQTYYRTMQELLTINMQGAVESIFYHLSDLRGLSQWTDAFGAIGLSTERIDVAIQVCGSLRLKINEMLHLLTTGNKNLKAFSSWLYSVILRLSEQPVPESIGSVLPDFHAVADFLNDNFAGLEENRSHIKLERVGQYLKECDLTSPPKPSDSSLWSTLEKSPLLSASKLIYKSEPTKSLYQLYKQMALEMRDALTTPAMSVINTMSVGTRQILSGRCKIHRLRQFPVLREDSTSHVYTILLAAMEEDNSRMKLTVSRHSLDENDLPLYQCELRFGQLTHSASLYACVSHRIIDFDHYKDEDILVLLQQTEGENSQSFISVRLKLADLPADVWTCNGAIPTAEAGHYVSPSYIKILDNVANAIQISASGKRDIGSVMLSSRRVRLFMYDVDDDSDDEESMSHDTTNPAADDSAFGSDKENVNN